MQYVDEGGTMQMAQEHYGNTQRAMVARTDAAFPWYIGGAFVVAVAGGFMLAVLLPLAVVLEWDWGVRWRALAQAHGHLQIAGWLGLFIAGMSLRLAPRFAGRPLRFAALTAPALALLLFGVLGRALAQPLVEDPAMRGILFVSVLAECVGAVLVALSLIATLAPAAGTLAPAPFLMLGAIGMVSQAVLGTLWLPDLSGDQPFVAANRNDVLLGIQFFAFVLPFVLGVSLRALPVFFARPAPSVRSAWVTALVLGAGTAAYAGGAYALEGAGGVRIQGVGAISIAVAIAAVLVQTGTWRQPERLRTSARHTALLIRTASAWLALVALALMLTGVQSVFVGTPVLPGDADAIRHALAIGVFTTMLAGMAYLMLPWLAMRRMKPAALRRETLTLWALLTLATVLRVGGALLEDGGVGADRYWPMAAGGVLALSAIGLLASIVMRAARPETPEIVLHERITPP
jgi:uncharacterized protein involved in response to NO